MLTLIAGDHITDLLEDVCKASSACDFCVFLGRSESPRSHWPRCLQGRELCQEHIWEEDTKIMHQDLFLIVFHQFLYILNIYLVVLFTYSLSTVSLHAHPTWCCHRHGWPLPSECIWTGCWSPYLSLPLSSAAPVSPSSSPSSSEETLGASAQSSWW